MKKWSSFRKGQGQAQDLPFGFWFLGHENPISGGSGHILKHRSVPINDVVETLNNYNLKEEIIDEFLRMVLNEVYRY